MAVIKKTGKVRQLEEEINSRKLTFPKKANLHN